MAKAWIGVSGWTYPGWRGGVFYPEKHPQKRELEYASGRFTSIEINGTFYSLQKPASFQAWYDQTPEGFRFSVKAGQFMTHVRRLKDIEGPLAFFLASGLFRLGEKLGPILWQFPPNVMLKDDRFHRFLDLLPKSTREATRLLARHKDRLRYPEEAEPPRHLPLRHAFELRHKSFFDPKFFDLLRAHGVALVLAHGAEKAPYAEELTADFIYARLHGEGKRYAKGYPPVELQAWADRIRAWLKGGRDSHVYFSTEAKAHAPACALRLLALLSVEARRKQDDPLPPRSGR